MKKLFLSLFFATGIFILLSQGEIVWSNRLYLDEPRVHKIEKGEYLSKLAERYYGDPQRWRELALINRAPNPNHVEVGEEILVPAANKAAEVSRARTLTQVNTIVRDQEGLAVREPSTPMTNAAPTTTMPTSAPEVNRGNGTIEPEPVAPITEETPAPVVEENGFPWLWVGIGAAILAIVGVILYRRRQSTEQEVDINIEKKDNGVEEFRSRRQYGMPAKSQNTEQKKGIEATA